MFEENCVVSDIKLINTEGNVTFIVSELLKDLPSAYEHFACTNTKCKGIKDQKLRTIILQQDLINISYLEKAIVHYVEKKNFPCRKPFCCDGQASTKRNLHDHLFIEADQVDDICNFTMADFPTTLNINDSR